MNNPEAIFYLVIPLSRHKEKENERPKKIINLILKTMAMAIPIVSLVMGFFPGEADVETHITMLSIGLVALAIAAIRESE